MEDTTKQIQVDNEPLIAEMIRKAEMAPEPGTLEKVIHKGDEEQPAPMTLAELTSAGWCYIYETRTGERSVANKNMLPQLLKIKNAEKTLRFTTIKPAKPPFPITPGILMCMLHPEYKGGEFRDHFDELGLPKCRKSNLTSPYQVRRHMIKKHPDQWAVIEQERVDKERKEDREFQHAMLGAVRPTEKPPLYVSDKDKAKK